MTLIGNFTGGTMSASTVTINNGATVASVRVNGTHVINGMRTGRVANPFSSEGTKVTMSWGVTFPSVPTAVILQIDSATGFCMTVVVSAVTTTNFTAYFYKSGTDTDPTITALNWWAIY